MLALRYVYLIALVTWLGGMVVLGAIVGALFGVLLYDFDLRAAGYNMRWQAAGTTAAWSAGGGLITGSLFPTERW